MQWNVMLFAALGGFLFGYDTSVINGALFQMKEHFGFSEHSWEAGLIVSIAIAGCFVGAFIPGFFARCWGRRTCIAIADVLFIIGSVVMAVANSASVVLVGRAIVGLGIGICSVIIPVYLAEVTSADSRGAAIVLNNVCLTGAQLIAACVTALFVQFTSINLGWRLALGLGAVPAVVQLIGLIFFLPESPRWLLSKGNVDEAQSAAKRLKIDSPFSSDNHEVAVAMNYGGLLKKGVRRRLLISCMLHILQQVSGINTIMYYSSLILSDAGFKDPKTPVILSIPLAGINSIATVFTVFTVDRWGRRRLLQISALGCLVVTVAMTVVGFLLEKHVSQTAGGWTFLSLLGVYLVFFAPGLGAMPWVVMGEIFPNNLRTPAASVATMCNWASNALVSQVFPSLMGHIGVGGTFSIICACITSAAIFIYFFVVETRGLTLEEIEVLFTKDHKECSSSEDAADNKTPAADAC